MTMPLPFPPILKVGVFPERIDQKLHQTFQLVEPGDLDGDPALCERIEGIVTRSNYRIAEALIDRLPKLRIIATNGVGYDGIPVEYAEKKGIVVTNTPDVLNEAVAELAVGLLLSLLRHIPAADAFVKSGAWQTAPFPLTTTLAGKRAGIVGLGRIGREIAQRLVPFRVDIAYFGRTRQDLAWDFFDDIEKLAADVDILIVCCPGGPATHHLINAAVLRALGPSGVLINVARGSVVDEAQLCAALAGKVIAGAALDVFNEEPLGDSPLCGFSNVVLAPHMGSATNETRLRMAQLAIDNLSGFFKTGQALTPVG